MKRGPNNSVKDFVKAKEANSLILAREFLMNNDEIGVYIFSKVVQEQDRLYYRVRKQRLYLNAQGVLCCSRKASDRPVYMNDLIVLPQLFQPKLFA